jgi:hypothetical protein
MGEWGVLTVYSFEIKRARVCFDGYETQSLSEDFVVHDGRVV